MRRCSVCGISLKDRLAIEIMLRVPGRWEVLVHKGHVVKMAQKGREEPIDELIEKYSDVLTLLPDVLE